MKFVNKTNMNLQTVWVDYKGSLIPYANIKPGISCNQQTYITHQWLIGDNIGPFFGYKPMMNDVFNLDYVLITFNSENDIVVEEIKKNAGVEISESKICEKEQSQECIAEIETIKTYEADTQETETISVAENM